MTRTEQHFFGEMNLFMTKETELNVFTTQGHCETNSQFKTTVTLDEQKRKQTMEAKVKTGMERYFVTPGWMQKVERSVCAEYLLH